MITTRNRARHERVAQEMREKFHREKLIDATLALSRARVGDSALSWQSFARRSGRPRTLVFAAHRVLAGELSLEKAAEVLASPILLHQFWCS